MSQPVLYHYPLSINSQTVRMTLAEKGVAWHGVVVDIGPAHENFAPAYMRLNPAGVVPTLRHDGELVTDTVAICRYVDARFVGPALQPADDAARRTMEIWIGEEQAFPERELSCGLVKGLKGWAMRRDLDDRIKLLTARIAEAPELAELYQRKVLDVTRLKGAVGDDATIEAMLARAEESLDRLDAHLAGREFIAGDAMSLADIAWTCLLARTELLDLAGATQASRRPALAAYYARMKARPSFAAAGVTTSLPIVAIVPSLAKAYGPAAAGIAIFALILAYVAYTLT